MLCAYSVAMFTLENSIDFHTQCIVLIGDSTKFVWAGEFWCPLSDCDICFPIITNTEIYTNDFSSPNLSTCTYISGSKG